MKINGINQEVRDDIRSFLNEYIDSFKQEAEQLGLFEDDGFDSCEGYQLTIAIADDGDRWNYQTGDNSYTGNAYSLPHWAVLWIGPDSTVDELYSDTINQLEDLIYQ